MELYFSPLACSLASRITAHEIGVEIRFIEVDSQTKRLPDGSDYRQLNPTGMVPMLRLDDGRRITENAAILQYLARAFPEARIGAADEDDLVELQRWLSFIGSELHKTLFMPLLSKSAGPETKAFALAKGEARMDHLNAHLTGRDFLLDHFSVADSYLAAVLNWTLAAPVDLARWPEVKRYHAALRSRPSIAKAFGEELELYRAESARHQAA